MTSQGWAAVLFDLDGTLADTVPLILKSFRHTMGVHLGEVPPDAEWLTTIGRPLRDQLDGFARSPDEARAMVETYVAYQQTIHDDMARAFPGAPEVVAELKSGGSAVAVVTSKRSGIAQRTLECCGLGRAFDVVVCADHVTKAKPHPESVELALGLLNLSSPSDVLFVGDSPYDMHAGREGGVRTAGALWGPHSEKVLRDAGADYLVGQLTDVPRLRR